MTVRWRVALLLALSACVPNPARQERLHAVLNSHTGQLFCRFETSGHAQIVGGLIASGANAAGGGPLAGAAVILATDASAAYAAAACAQAAAKIGATAGVPSPPPPPTVAVVPLVEVDPGTLPARQRMEDQPDDG